MDDGFDAEEEERLKGIERYREVYEMSAIDGSMGGQESAELRELRVKHGISDDMAAQIAAETTQPRAEAVEVLSSRAASLVVDEDATTNLVPVHGEAKKAGPRESFREWMGFVLSRSDNPDGGKPTYSLVLLPDTRARLAWVTLLWAALLWNLTTWMYGVAFRFRGSPSAGALPFGSRVGRVE